jgi:hypothetical protein
MKVEYTYQSFIVNRTNAETGVLPVSLQSSLLGVVGGLFFRSLTIFEIECGKYAAQSVAGFGGFD